MNKAEKKWTWGQRNSKLSDERWELVVDNFDIVDKVLDYLGTRYHAIKEDRETYYEAGMWGLIHAARKYDFDRDEAKFSTYALTAIRRDISRVLLKNYTLKKRFKSREAYQEMLSDNDVGGTSDSVSPSYGDSILTDLVGKEETTLIRLIIKKAPERHKKIIKMRFFDKKNFKEIGEEFGVSREMARIYTKDAVNYVSEKFKNTVK